MADDLLERAKRLLQGDGAPSTSSPPSVAPTAPTEAPEGKEALGLEYALALEALAAGGHRQRNPINEPVYDPSKTGRDTRGRVVGWTLSKPSTLPTPVGFDPDRWREITNGSVRPSSYDLAREIHDAATNVIRDQAPDEPRGVVKDYLMKDVLGGAGRGMEALFSGAVGLGHAGFEAVQLGAQDLAMKDIKDPYIRSLIREQNPVPAKALRERAFSVAGEALFGEKRAAHMAEQKAQTGDRPVPEKTPESFVNPTYKGFTLTPFATEAAGGELLANSALGDIAVAASNIGPLALDIATPAEALTGPALKAGRAVRAFDEARRGVADAASALFDAKVMTPSGIHPITAVRPDGMVVAGGHVIDLMPMNRFQVADEIRNEVMRLQSESPSLLQRGDAAIDKVVDKVVGKTGETLAKITPESIRKLGRLALKGASWAVGDEFGSAVNAHAAERRLAFAQATDKASRLKDAVKGASEADLADLTKYIGGEESVIREATTTPAVVAGRHTPVADMPYSAFKDQMDETGTNAIWENYYLHSSESPALGSSGIKDQGGGVWASHPSKNLYGGRKYLYAIDRSQLPEDFFEEAANNLKAKGSIPPEAVIPLGEQDGAGLKWLHDKFVKSSRAINTPEAVSESVSRALSFPKSLPPETKAIADDIREVIQTMRQKGVQEGTISKETFDEFVNGYLIRTYETTLEKQLAAGGTEGERLMARMDLPKIRKNGYGAVLNLPEDHVRLLIPEEDAQHLVYHPHSVKDRTLVKFEDSAEGMAARNRLLSKTTNDQVAFRFNPLSQEERAALNEVTDPVELTKMTLQKIGRENADATFLNSVARNPQYALPEGAAPAGWKKVPMDARWGPLKGKSVEPGVYSVLQQKIETDVGFGNFVRGAVGAFRANMLFTPRTATRNLISNFLMYAPLNHVDPLNPDNWKLWAEAAGELTHMGKTGQMSPDLATMFKGGVEMDPLSQHETDFILDIERVGSGIHDKKHSAELLGQRIMNYATGSPLTKEATATTTAAARGGSAALARGGKALLEGRGVGEAALEAVAAGTANAAVIGPAMEKVQAAYNAGDKWLKLTAFKRWRMKGLEQGLDAAQATRYAIKQTSKFTQNFGEVGGAASALTGRGQSKGATMMKVVGFPFAPSFWDQHAKILARSAKEQPLLTMAMMSRRYAMDAAAWASLVGTGSMTQEQYTKWRRQNPEKVPVAGADGKVYAWDDTYLFPGFPRTSESGTGAPNFEGAKTSFGDPATLGLSMVNASPAAAATAEGAQLARAASENKPREAKSLFTGAPLVRGAETIPEAGAKNMGERLSNPLSPAYGRDIGRIQDTLTKKSKGRLPDEEGKQEEQNLPLTLLDTFLGVKLRETSGIRADQSSAIDLKEQVKNVKAAIVDAAKEAKNYLSIEEGERILRRAGNINFDRANKGLNNAVKRDLLTTDQADKVKASLRKTIDDAIEEQVKALKAR